jgi:starvation-inducible outer membrane lipoprotein
MIRFFVLLLIAVSMGLAGCVTPPENKPVGPESSASKMPWNTPRPGEGQAQFGGMLQRR